MQTVAGDVVTVTYDDVLNDYGNAETLVTTAVYGGWSGSVSGTWTAANNPYVVTGDLYVDNGQSLTVEAGVEVRFYGEYYFYVYGSLSAEGTEGDSIYFRNHVDEDDVLDWRGLYINLYYDQENITMSHVSLDGSSNAGLIALITNLPKF